MPSSRISKQPTSSAAPYRFFVARTRRSDECRSPSKCSTTSTRCSSTRGPAIEPSLVTCPTSTVAMPRALATAMSAAATARICGTPPAAPSLASLEIVCTESTTSRPGRTSSTWVSRAPRSFSAARNRPGCTLPVRSARSRTWAGDSSPVTINARSSPRAAKRWATSSSSVDLPTPGSPASSTTEPGTSPPPSTRSSSPTPVGRARASSGSSSPIGRAARVTGAGETARRGKAPSSATVPHAWHSGQRPTQRTDSVPHSVQRKPGLRAPLGLVTR